MRVGLIQLPYLAVGPPTQIAVPGVPKVRLGDGLEATCRVEPRSELACDPFVLNEPVLPSQPNGLFIETLGVKLSAFDAGDLGTDQRGSICEVLGAVMGPDLELPMMRG